MVLKEIKSNEELKAGLMLRRIERLMVSVPAMFETSLESVTMPTRTSSVCFRFELNQKSQTLPCNAGVFAIDLVTIPFIRAVGPAVVQTVVSYLVGGGNSEFSKTGIGGRSERRFFFCFEERRGARRKREIVALFRAREEVGSDKRARLANRILDGSVGDVEERKGPTLFAQSEYERLRTNTDTRVYGTIRLYCSACRQRKAQ